MLYIVGWELISWANQSSYIAELSPDEHRGLIDFFDKERREGRVMNYRITPVEIRSEEAIRGIYTDDLRIEDECQGGIGGE